MSHNIKRSYRLGLLLLVSLQILIRSSLLLLLYLLTAKTDVELDLPIFIFSSRHWCNRFCFSFFLFSFLEGGRDMHLVFIVTQEQTKGHHNLVILHASRLYIFWLNSLLWVCRPPQVPQWNSIPLYLKVHCNLVFWVQLGSKSPFA